MTKLTFAERLQAMSAVGMAVEIDPETMRDMLEWERAVKETHRSAIEIRDEASAVFDEAHRVYSRTMRTLKMAFVPLVAAVALCVASLFL